MAKDSDGKLSEMDPMLKAEILEIQTCPECRSKRLIRDYECAEIVCMNCGFVVNHKIADKRSEKRVFNEEQKSKRTKAVPLTFTIHDKGLTTVIDWHSRNNYNKNLSVGQKTQSYRLRKWHRRVKVTGSTERNLIYALSEIAKTANKLNLPKNVLEITSVIYQKVIKEHLINGRSIQGIAIASLYLACRKCKLPITLDELAHISAINRKELGRNYRFLIKKLAYSTLPRQPNQYIIKCSNKVIMQRKIEEITHKILTAAKDSKLTSDCKPTCTTAAASYIALLLIGEHKSQNEIADIAQTTKVTVRKRYKEIVCRLMFEISL